MNLYEFVEKNNIAILAKADYRTKKFDIIKRDVMLEHYDLFEQLIVYSDVENLFESVTGQILPRIWSQGKTKCVICRINEEMLVALFYDTSMSVMDNYLFAKQVDMKMKELRG